jgi:hypothetical protein
MSTLQEKLAYELDHEAWIEQFFQDYGQLEVY